MEGAVGYQENPDHIELIEMEGAVEWQENAGHRELGDMERGTIEEANRIKEDQGNHEAEVSLRGELDLHIHHKKCEKNPGHVKFKPVQDFKIEDLPEDYQVKEIMEWIKTEADLTCRVAVKWTSKSRPKYYPGTEKPFSFYKHRGKKMQRNGTGYVMSVSKYTDANNRQRGKVTVGTANHVVFNSEEAMCATCYFFYDTSTNDLTDFPTLTEFNVQGSNIAGDWSIMTTVTCEMAFVDKLDKMCDRRLKLFERVRAKYWLDQRKGLFGPGISRVTDPTSGHVVIISHPHGCDKRITVGEWTHRETRAETKNYEVNSGVKAEYVSSSYRYNAPTCPGSSGAPVIRLLEKGRVGWWWLLYPHPHSEGKPGNDNSSGMMEEFVSFPPTSSDKWSLSAKIACALFTLLTIGIWLAVAGIEHKMGTPIFWFTPFIVVIPSLCYVCIRCCRKHRQTCFFIVILITMFPVGVLVLPLELANVPDTIFLVMSVIGVVILICTAILFYRWARDQQSSLNIQKRLRQLIMMETSSVPLQATSQTTTTTSTPTTTALSTTAARTATKTTTALSTTTAAATTTTTTAAAAAAAAATTALSIATTTTETPSTTATATATTITVDIMTYHGTIANTAEPTDYSQHPRPS